MNSPPHASHKPGAGPLWLRAEHRPPTLPDGRVLTPSTGWASCGHGLCGQTCWRDEGPPGAAVATGPARERGQSGEVTTGARARGPERGSTRQPAVQGPGARGRRLEAAKGRRRALPRPPGGMPWPLGPMVFRAVGGGGGGSGAITFHCTEGITGPQPHRAQGIMGSQLTVPGALWDCSPTVQGIVGSCN